MSTGVDVNAAQPIGHGFIRDGKIDATRYLKVEADGSINVNGGASITGAEATAADPTYVEGTNNPLSQDLSGHLRVVGTFSVGEGNLNSTGSVGSAAVIITQASTIGYFSCFFQIGGIGTSTVVAEINNNGTWVATEVAPVATGIGQSSVTANGMYFAQTGGKGFRLRVSVYDGSATVTADAEFRGFTINPMFPTTQPVSGTVAVSNAFNLEATQSAFKTANHSDLAAINTTLGTPMQATGGTVQLVAGAAVIGHVINDAGAAIIGKVGIDQTTPGTTNAVSAVLTAGSALVGKVGIDQTTPGTTNAVAATNFPTTVDTNSGNKSASTPRVVIATDQPNLTTPLNVQGAAATDAAVSGNPLQGGGRAATAAPTAVQDGDAVPIMLDKVGKQVVVGAVRDLVGNQKTTLSNTTSETTIVTAVSSTFLDLYGLILANSGATATKVDIRDDTAGTIRATIYVPAGDTRGFMLPAGDGMKQTATNKNWTAQCSAATTALEVTAMFVKNI